MRDKREVLYNNLINSGRVDESQIGSLDEFRNAIKDEGSARKFYANLRGAGFGEDEIGDEDAFYSSIESDFAAGTTVKRRGRDEALNGGTEKVQVVRPYVDAERYLAGQKSLQQRVEEARREADAAKNAANSYAAPWQVNKMEAPEGVARPKQMTPWDVERAAFEEAEEKRIDFRPRVAQTERDVYDNYMERFGLTEEGKRLNEEYNRAMREIGTNLWKEWADTDEYRTIVAAYNEKAKGVKSKEELEGLNQRMNDELSKRFELEYGDRYRQEAEPYDRALHGAMQNRYGKQIQAENMKLDKAAQGGIVSDMTAKVDDMLSRAQGGRENRFVGPYLSAARGRSAMTDEERALNAAKRQLEEANETINAVKNDSGFFKALSDKSDWEKYTFGIVDAEDTVALRRALTKSEEGKELTDAEQALLDATLTNMTVQGYYSDELNTSYGTMGVMAAESIPFMLEFLVNPISGSGNTIAKGLLKYGMKKFGLSTAKKNFRNRAIKTAARLVGDATSASVMTGTTSAGRVAAGTLERLNDNYDIRQGEDMSAYAVLNGKDMGVGEALARSAASTFFENQSEMIFNAFPGVGKKLGEYARRILPGGESEMLSRLIPDKIGNLWTQVRNNPYMRGMRKRAQIGGIGEEYLEEVYNNFANVLIGEMSIEDATSLENNVDTFLGLVPTQLFFSAMGIGGYAVARRKNNKAIERYRGMLTEDVQREVEAVVNEAIGNPERLNEYFVGLAMDESLTPEQRKGRMELAVELNKRNLLDGIEEAKQADEPTRQEAAMEAGVAAENPEEKHAISRRYEDAVAWREKLTDEDGQLGAILDMEDREIAVVELEKQGYSDRMQEAFDYWDAMDAYEGMAIGANNRVDEAVADANWQAARRAHVDGRIIEATTVDRGIVHVKGGNIVWNDDGTVNVALSDPQIFVVNEEGRIEMMSPRHITAVAERGTLQAQREYNNTTLRGQLEKQEVDEVELNPNTPQVMIGTTYADNGRQMVVVGVNEDNAMVVPVDDKGAVPLTMPVDEIRAIMSTELDAEEGARRESEAAGTAAAVDGVNGADGSNGSNDGSNGLNGANDGNLSVETAENEGAPVGGIEQSVSGEGAVSEQAAAETEQKPVDITRMSDEDARVTLYNKYGDNMKRKVAATRKSADKELEKAVKALAKAEDAALDAPIGSKEEEKADAALVKAREAMEEAKRKADFWGRMDDGFNAAQQESTVAGPAGRTDASLDEPQTPEERAAEALGSGEMKLTQDSFKRETGYGNVEARGFIGLFAGADKGGMTIEQAAEYLVAQDGQRKQDNPDWQPLFGGDVQLARAAIIDVLMSTRTKGELRGYISNRRKNMTEEEARAEREAYEEWTMGNYGMTPEEYEAYEESVYQAVQEKAFTEEEYIEYISNFADENLNDNQYGLESNEQSGTDELREGSGTVLPSEQSVQTGRTGGIEEESSEADVNINSADAASQEEAGEIKPVELGENSWGKVFQWVKGKVVDAAKFLKKSQNGYLRGVFYREELGDIDLFWGNEKGGLAHIIDKHIIKHSDFASVEDAVSVIDDVISTGEIIEQPNGRIAFLKDGYRVVTERTFEGNWVVTAFDETVKQKDKKRSEEDATRLHQDIFGKENGELVSPNSASEGKGSESSVNEQGIEGISSEKDGENGFNGGANRLVSDARYAELRERMRKKLGGQMNIGIDPEILAIGTEMAVYHLEKGARKFVDYARAMIADLGDAIRPYLKAFYNGARELPEVIDGGLSAEMTSYDEVQRIDVANLGKRVVNPVDAAEVIVKEDAVEKQAKVAKERVKNSRGKKQDGGMLGLFDVQKVTDGDLVFTEVEQPKSEKKSTKKGKQSEKQSEEKSPVWQYSVYVDKETGRTSLRRDDVSGVYPIGDARFTVEAASPEEMLDILRNPLNGMQEVLDAVGVTLENKIATRKMNEAVGYTGADGVNGLNETKSNGLDETRRAFADAVARDMLEALESGVKPYRSIVDLRKRAQSVGMEVDSEGRTDILLQELVENGLVKAAREVIAKSGRNSRTSFDLICKLYDMQPTIGARSSERVKMQQYSTPLPMAWVANHFAMAGKSSGQVLEPTAGNGMLVFTVPVEQVHANELDETRLDNLREQGFAKVTNQDANKPFSGEYDVLIANPPFGQRIAKVYDGKLIGGLDPQITVNALQSLKDDGRAAIIIGGNMEYADNGSVKGLKPFFTYLYDHYNVKGIVDMDGKLYQKQGTTFPTRMILIEGRRSAEERAQSAVYPPVKDRAIRKAETFEDLYEIVNEIINSKEKTNGTEILRSTERGTESVTDRTSGNVDQTRRSEQSNESNGAVERLRRGLDSRPSDSLGTEERNGATNGGRGTVGGRRGDGSIRTGNDERQSDVFGQSGNDSSESRSWRNASTSERGTTGRTGRAGQLDAGDNNNGTSSVRSTPILEEKRTLDEGKLPYRPHNTAFSLQSVAPAAMVEAMDKMLAKIEEKHGSIDEFVRSELGYDTIEEAHNALAAEQMDSVAMAIYQMKNGQAMIIGDQTGVGKGRQMAALIRWAVMRGEKPVFITQKADLFSDIYRDLVDVGSGDLRPFIFNSDGAMVDNNGVVVHKPLSSSEMAKVFQSGQLPDGYDFAVLTYSQVNTGDAISQEEAAKAAKESGKRGTKKSKSSKEGKATPKATFLRAIANDNYLFLDESHTAAGSSNTGAYLQSILKTAKAATFASATFAKRPDTMPLYAIRTAMSKAKIDTNELISIIEKGGVTLQEIMSRALTEAGQMVRRERDMSDVRTDWKTITDEATVKRARENYDRTIEAFNAIIRFQEEFVTPMIEELDKEVAAMAETAKVKKGTEKMGVENVPFASKTYNYTKQLMLALKVDAIVDEVVAEIEAGRHPVIALESTMEASIKDYVPGSVIEEPTFSASLLRGLDTVMQYTVTDENGKESHRRYSPAQLGEEGERAYYELQDFIREATSDIFISPLDAIIEGLKQRGYKVGELTGRSSYVERNDEGQVVVRRRTDKDKKRMQREFNNGTLDVLILNKSASTGISLHASSRFSDQRQRSMIIAQPLSDINDYMQMIGRIDRTGQVHRGYYINLGLPVPAENRFLMMLSTKLKSLNANTTTSQDSESNDVEAPDLLNKYGSKVVVEYLRDNKGIYEKMGEPLKGGKGRVSSSELDEYVPQEDDARKITGYVALLSTSEQDAFYDDVVRRYKELIKYLDDTGSNDLKITVMPLRAQTIDKRVSSEGIDPNGENPFASNAYVERVEMDVLRKPMKASEVRAVMESLAKGEEPTAHVKSIAATVRQEVKEKLDAEDARYERAKERMAENVEKQAAKINGQKKLTDEQKRSSIERVREEERERVELQHNEAVKRIGLTRDNFLQRLNMFRVGNTYMVPDNLETPTFMFSSPAIFCGYKAKDRNLTPSTTLAVFATLDGRRRVEVKLSEINPLRVISDATSNNWDTVSRTNLDTWDSMRPTSTRKEGYIMTGNILQAVADTKDENGHYPGQLISFTDMDGNVRDGILMPDKWDTSQLKSGNVPLNARMAQIKAGNWVESHDGKVSLSKGYGSSYHVTVPKTKKSGGAYYLNEDLLDLVDGHVFYPWRGEFRADIPAENIEKAVNILSNLGVKVKGETGKEETRFREGEGEMTDRDVVMQSDMYSAFLGKPRYSGKRMRDYVARQRGKMVDRVKDMAKKMGVEVTIINSVADAPKEVKRILRKHPKSKGWYDVATGKVVIIMPNHGSVEDVTSTVLHECVAHYGLRKLFGKRFDKFLDNVYMNADPDVFKRISELAQKNGWDYRVATEEYLASLAEDTNFENATNSGWFQRIKDFFIDMMHALGLDDVVGASLSDNELRYILWRSYENMVRPGSYLNKFAEAGDMSMQKRLKVGDYEALVDIQRLGNVDLSEYVPMAAEERVVGDDGLRFRDITDDAVRGAVEDFAKRYNAAPVEELPSEYGEVIQNLLDDGYGESEAAEIYEELKNTPAIYDPVDDKIYIFAGKVSVEDVEEVLIHENTHRAIEELLSSDEKAELANALDELHPTLGEKIRKSPSYKDSDFDNEIIAYSVQFGHRKGMESYLGELAGDKRIQDILKFIGYDGRRKNRAASEIGEEVPVLVEPRNTGKSDSRGKDGRRNTGLDTRQAGVAQSNDEGGYRGRRNLILDEVVRLEEELGSAVNAIDSFDALPEGRAKDAIAEGRKVLGWYQDGRVYVYMPNARSASDVRATVYHEVVGHLGLRELLGDRFNKFLDRVYMNLPADVRAELNNRAMRKGWDFREATEEYMAELAERFARGEKVSGLRKVLYAVRDAVVKALRSLGVDLGFEMSDNYLMYVLWASKQNLKPSNVMGRIADRYMRDVLNVDGDVVRAASYHGMNGSDGMRYRGIEEVNERFNEQLEGLTEQNAREKILDLGVPSDILLSCGIENKHIRLYGAKLLSKIKKHGYLLSDIKDLPNSLISPIAVFRGSQNGSYAILTELHIDGNNVLVSLSVGKGGHDVDFNVISSIYGKNNDGVIRWINDGKLLYVNKRKALNYLSVPAPIAGAQDNQELVSAAKVVENFENPKVEGEKDSANGRNSGYRGGELRFREVEPEDDVTRMTREAYEKNLKSLSYRLREGFQDSMLALKELQEAIVKTLGHDLEEYENAYVEENHLSSKNTAEFDYLTKKLYKPLIEVVHELMKGGNMSYQDVLDYLNAKHGVERNRDWAVRDALNAMRKEAEDDAQRQVVDDMEQSYYDYRDAMYEELENGYIDFDQYCDLMDAKARDYVPGYDGKEDYSGLSSVFGEDGDVDAEWYDRARGYVRNVEGAMPDVAGKLWEAVRSVNQFSLDKAKNSGTMSVADHQKISNQFKWYVPLRGFDETTAEEAYEYFSRDSATGAYQSTIKKGRGRKSQAADMIATMMNVAQSTIMHGNKNLMKQKFLNLVMNSKTGLVTVLDNWYVNTGTIDDPIWEPAYPKFKPEDTAEEIAQAIEDFKADMEAKEKQGLAKKTRGGERIPYRTTKKSQLDEHIVIAKRNGQEFRMVLNGNPRAAQALNGLTNPDTAEGVLERVAHIVNPILAPLFTTQNPTFIARNLIRDSLMSGSSVMIKESFWYGQRFRGNQLRSLGHIGSLIKKYEAGTLDESVPMERYFKEFIENGAETGYSQLWSVDKFKAEIEKDLERMEGGLKNGTISKGKALLDGLAFVNRCAEDMNRFAVYMTSRESGRSIQRSVHDAKEITVNFNKKGAGAKSGGWIGATAQFARTFYLFFNAGIQGLNNYARMAKEHPAEFAGVVSLFGGLGALMPLANALMIAMFGDDDDKDIYNDLPEWVRRNNICLYVPFAGKDGTVITLPLPIELRAIYGLGEAVMQISLGNEPEKDALLSVANQFMEMMPVNPVSSGGAVQAFTPTVFQPIVQHVQNKDWTGTPIYKESDFNKRYPEYTQAYKGTPKLLVQTSKFLNDLTGGNEVKRGWLQMNPGIVSNYISGYTGGVGTTLMDIEKSVEMFFDEPFDLRNIPVVKAVAQTPTERNKYASTTKKYFELAEELKQYEHEKRGYKRMIEEGGSDAAKYMELYRKMHDTETVARMKGIKAISNQLKELKDMEGVPADSLKMMENELRKKAVELYGK